MEDFPASHQSSREMWRSPAWLVRAFQGYIFLSTWQHQASATCFLPNGMIPSNQSFPHHPAEEYAPCDNTTGYSMCCRTNMPSSNGKGSTCRSDGLCTLQEDQSVWRVACTDPTWQSDDCIKLCTTGRGMCIGVRTLKVLVLTESRRVRQWR